MRAGRGRGKGGRGGGGGGEGGTSRHTLQRWTTNSTQYGCDACAAQHRVSVSRLVSVPDSDSVSVSVSVSLVLALSLSLSVAVLDLGFACVARGARLRCACMHAH